MSTKKPSNQATQKPSNQATKKPSNPETKQPQTTLCKPINLALQGGGAHGAFTWGVLDQLLLDERVSFHAITATSAGAMNAVVLASGLLEGGIPKARESLKNFWRKVSIAAQLLPVRPSGFDKWLGDVKLNFSPAFIGLDMITRMFSPSQFNLFDINPLRSIVEEVVDFERIRANKELRIFLNATNVRTGKIKVFETKELTLDTVMASACLPMLYKTVIIDGEPYWDGGYSGNPALFPLIYQAKVLDVVLIEVNPLVIEDVPTRAADIMDRINEISFNSNLMGEMRAIEFVARLLDSGKLKDPDYKRMRMHKIEAAELMATMGQASKLNADWDFLVHLHDIGAQTAADWLEQSYDTIGVDSSIDVRDVFL